MNKEELPGLVGRMVEIANRDDTTGLATDALREAADTLKSLAAENERLREALGEIAERPGCSTGWAKGVGEWPIDEAENMAKIARKALSGEE